MTGRAARRRRPRRRRPRRRGGARRRAVAVLAASREDEGEERAGGEGRREGQKEAARRARRRGESRPPGLAGDSASRRWRRRRRRRRARCRATARAWGRERDACGQSAVAPMAAPPQPGTAVKVEARSMAVRMNRRLSEAFAAMGEGRIGRTGYAPAGVSCQVLCDTDRSGPSKRPWAAAGAAGRCSDRRLPSAPVWMPRRRASTSKTRSDGLPAGAEARHAGAEAAVVAPAAAHLLEALQIFFARRREGLGAGAPRRPAGLRRAAAAGS